MVLDRRGREDRQDREHGRRFELTLPGRVVFGRGVVQRLGEEARRLGGDNALVVTTRGMLERGILAWVRASLRGLGVDDTVFPLAGPEPSLETVGEITAVARDRECNLLVGLGGGRVLDVAKKAAAMLGVRKIMAPTTAGSGSEATDQSALLVAGELKIFTGADLMADVALVDPDLLATVPPRLMAAAGMDALAHAIEGYQSRRSNSLVRGHAWRAFRLVSENLEAAAAGDEAAGTSLALASLLAGVVVANAGTCLGHALSYPLTRLGVPHGQAVATMLPYALEFNGFDAEVAAEVHRLVSGLHIACTIGGDARRLAVEVMRNSRDLENNPRRVTLEDVVALYQRARREMT